MKHVALFLTSFGGGGAERVMLKIAEAYAVRGFRVSLLVVNPVGELEKSVAKGIDVVRLDCGRVVKALMPLARWLKANRPDALLSTQVHANIIASVARKLSGIPCRLILREASTASINMSKLPLLSRWLLKALMSLAYPSASVLVAVSRDSAEDMQRYLRSPLLNMQVIYNPVVSPEIHTLAAVNPEHPWFAETRQFPVILAVGRMTEAKNFPLLIEAFSRIQADSQARLLILGEGTDRISLEKLIAVHQMQFCIQMPGFDANPYKYMKRADLFVLSSRWEGLPNVLIQALTLGCPVVSTDCPSGPREILDNGRLGILVESDNAGQLAEAMKQALLSGRNSVCQPDDLERFSVAYVMNQYCELV